jgi:hypothetical protein
MGMGQSKSEWTAMRTNFRFLIASTGIGLAMTGPLVAQVQRVNSLAALDRGQWELRPRSGPPERLCIRDGRQLIQLRHPRLTCESFVVSDEPNNVTVQYTCRGKGYGRTHIRPETDRLVQLDTQGIVDGLPFNFEAEARWVGAQCTG